MALTHKTFDRTTHHSGLLVNMLSHLQEGIEQLNELVATMTAMINGDGSQDAHYDYMAAQFGFPTLQAPTGAAAKAAYLQALSLQQALDTNGSVSNLKTNYTQVFNDFR